MFSVKSVADSQSGGAHNAPKVATIGLINSTWCMDQI